jgi:uncharacterized membrane protein
MATVFGIFHDRIHAEAALADLKNSGYKDTDISILMRDTVEKSAITEDVNVPEETAAGAVTGGVLGAVAGLVIGATAITIPGVGPLLVAGPLAASLGISTTAATTLMGAATGAVGGGLISALTSAGLPEDYSVTYENALKNEKIVIGVDAQQGVDIARQIFEKHGATDIAV